MRRFPLALPLTLYAACGAISIAYMAISSAYTAISSACRVISNACTMISGACGVISDSIARLQMRASQRSRPVVGFSLGRRACLVREVKEGKNTGEAQTESPKAAGTPHATCAFGLIAFAR